MPFKSDKQRRYLWSQKPEVAKQIAYKQDGGGVYSAGLSDSAAKWWNERMAGVPQHRGYADDPDDITEMIGQNPDDRITYNNPDLINPNIKRPMHYVDMATYYTPEGRAMGRDEMQQAKMAEANRRLREEAKRRGFVNDDGSLNFNSGGDVPMMGMKPKKVTQKDRYGNQVSVEFEPEVKPLDQTAIVKQMMEEVPMPMDMSIMDHPGEPRGTDTVPAWLTPGEFVVNAEAMSIPENAEMVEQINNQGRAMQAAKGGNVPFIASPMLTEPQYRAEGGWWSDLKKLMGGGYEEGDVETIIPPMAEEPTEATMPGVMPMSPEEALLRAREGERKDVYIDSRGYPTVGIGHRLPDRFANRVGQEFSQDQIDRWFADDRETARADARDNVGEETWKKLNRRQKDAMTSMAFQLGKGKQKEFDKMLTAMRDGDWEGVRREAKDSNWYKQTPKRVEDVVAAFRSDGGLIPAPGVSNPETDLPGPIYAFAGVDTSDPMTFMGDEWAQPIIDREVAAAAPQGNYAEVPMTDEIPDVDADMSSGWTPPMAMPDESSAEIPEGGSNAWDDFLAWAGDTSVADERNAAFNVKAEEANVAAAEADLAEMKAAQADPGMGVGPSDEAIAAQEEVVQHQKNKLADAETEVAANAALDLTIEDDLVEQNQPGVEDDLETLEVVAKDPAAEKEDDPSKESEKGQQSETEVIEVAKNADPGMVEKAKGFFKGAFSDLFDGKELARMAMLYVGSRALGYSHHGSLSWAAKGYLGRMQAKEQGINDLLKSGKYTPTSIEAYKKSGDISDLQTPGATFAPTGEAKQFVVNGKPVRAQKMKGSDGSYRWMDSKGQSINLTTAEEYNPAKVKGTPEYNQVINTQAKVNEDVLKGLQDRFGKIPGKKDQPTTYKTDMVPALQAKKVAEWAQENGVDAAQVGGLMEQAYHDMVNDTTPGRKRNLIPYMNSLIIRESTGIPTLFQTNIGKTDQEPRYISGEKMRMLNSNVLNAMGAQGKLSDKANIDRLNAFWTGAASKWNNLTPEMKTYYNDRARDNKHNETGFYIYANTEINKHVASL